MSTGAECGFKETAPGKWQYSIQKWPYGDNDEYESNGPFRSFSEARAHLDRSYGNPGGYSLDFLPEGQHVHEYIKTNVHCKLGFAVNVRVESLGTAATKAEVIALVKSLPDDHTAWAVSDYWGYKDGIACASCGKEKP